jgi:16S rRNA (guanine527-N7)-methyltransferase
MNDEGRAGDTLLARLAQHHDLSSAQLSQLVAVLRTLEDDEHAPTAIRDAKEVVNTHFADSLAALELDAVRGACRIADLGAGVGFPGVALAIALPRAEISLVESRRRKCEFLERVCVDAGIENARVVWGRAEEWQLGLASNDTVVARALATQVVVLEYAAPLLSVGGTLVDWRGARRPEQEQAALRAAEELGLRRSDVRRVEPFEGARDHHLHLYLKVRPTPDRFPRRAGLARKRPLGSGKRGGARETGEPEDLAVQPGAPSDRDRR